MKRGMDIFVCSGALLVLALPIIVLIVWIKLDSRGPVLFKQRRVGKGQTTP